MNEIMLNGNEFIKYDPRRKHLGQARSLTGYTIRSDSCRTVFPGECTEFQVSSELKDSCVIEPRWDARCNKGSSSLWPVPQVVPIEKGVVKLFNSGQDPIIIKKSDHLGQVLPEIRHPTDSEITPSLPVITRKPQKPGEFSSAVINNPDGILSRVEEQSFREALQTYDPVFDPQVSVYNGKSGPCFVEVNMGKNLPPQRKGQVPFYGRDNLVELQSKFDDLLTAGILSRPQEVGITVENTNASALVNG